MYSSVVIMSRAGEHKEDYHLKKIFEHQQRLQNDHHQTVVVMYKCTKSGRMIVSGGTNVQERLEYLLENDSQLKDAILDDEDAMNRCGSSQQPKPSALVSSVWGVAAS